MGQTDRTGLFPSRAWLILKPRHPPLGGPRARTTALSWKPGSAKTRSPDQKAAPRRSTSRWPLLPARSPLARGRGRVGWTQEQLLQPRPVPAPRAQRPSAGLLWPTAAAPAARAPGGIR